MWRSWGGVWRPRAHKSLGVVPEVAPGSFLCPQDPHTLLVGVLYFLLQMKQGSNRVSMGLERHGPIYRGHGTNQRWGVGAGRESPGRAINIPMSLAAQVLLPPQRRVLESTQPPEA